MTVSHYAGRLACITSFLAFGLMSGATPVTPSAPAPGAPATVAPAPTAVAPAASAPAEAPSASAAAAFGDHPYYLHGLSDLRAARWMIQHRPGNWDQTVDEVEAVRQIDAAIGEIKKASIDDGKNLEDHPPVDEHPDHAGRLHAAVDFLKKARQDISHDEDNSFAQGLQMCAYDHIDHALAAARRAIHANGW